MTSSFNAWSDPWLLVVDGDDQQRAVSLRDAFLQAYELRGLGTGLTPLDRDSNHRLLVSLAAVVLRECTDDEWDEVKQGRFPEHAVAAVGERYGERFTLAGERPFLQRWDRTHADLAALFSLDVDDAKERARRLKDRQAKLQPLDALHQHTPGGSSSKWAVRRDDRDVSDPAVLTQLLVTSWFQTKFGNGKDPWGCKALKGSAGTWHVNPLAIWLTDPESLGRTIVANVPSSWVPEEDTDVEDLPLFLEHGPLTFDPAKSHKSSVQRFTYAKTLPLVYFEDGVATGFVSGADAKIDIPGLGKDDKESLGLVHEHDHTRLYVRKKRKDGGEDLAPRGSFGARLTTTEGFERWFRNENGVSRAVTDWQGIARMLEVHSANLRDWTLSLFSDSGDPHGNRHWTAWDELPADFAAVDGDALVAVQVLLGFAADCRSQFVRAGRIATGDDGVPPLALNAQAAFYSALAPVILEISADVHDGVEIHVDEYVRRVTRLAIREFERATDSLMVPSRIADVAQARAAFSRMIRASRNRLIPQTLTKETA